MKVARSELMFATPTLAKMAVNAAKIAESTAHNCQARIRSNSRIYTRAGDIMRVAQPYCAVKTRRYGRPSPHHPGSIPLALSTGMAAGEVMNLIRSRAACWFGDLAETAAVNTM